MTCHADDALRCGKPKQQRLLRKGERVVCRRNKLFYVGSFVLGVNLAE